MRSIILSGTAALAITIHSAGNGLSFWSGAAVALWIIFSREVAHALP